MYGITHSDRLNIKRIAGRIVPAIATTTAAVSGLVRIKDAKLHLISLICFKIFSLQCNMSVTNSIVVKYCYDGFPW